MHRKMKIVTVPAGLLAAAGIALPAAAALAAVPNTTPGCAGKVYCGAQTDAASPALTLDVLHGTAAQNQPVIGWTNTTRAVDFDWYNPANPVNNDKFAQFAPGGIKTNFYLAQAVSGGPVVLRRYTGLECQKWTFQDNGTWTNTATGDVLTAGAAMGSAITGAPALAPGAVPATAQTWTYSS